MHFKDVDDLSTLEVMELKELGVLASAKVIEDVRDDAAMKFLEYANVSGHLVYRFSISLR